MAQMYNPAHPGRLLRQAIEGYTITEFAQRIGVSRFLLSKILNQRAGISAEMSLRLGLALGSSPEFWFSMQNQYDFWQASQKILPPIEKIPTAA